MATTTLGQFFTRGKRDDGSSFVTLSDDRPQWLYDAVYEAHSGDLPDDWTWEECKAACDAIDDGALSSDDDLHEHADGRVDIYTKVLFQWQADHCLGNVYSEAEERARELGQESGDQVKIVSAIQYCAIEAIAGCMLRAWEEAHDAS